MAADNAKQGKAASAAAIADGKYAWRAAIVERFILHEFAILTAYDKAIEELMLDVRTNDGFLVSGKFRNYSLDGKDLCAVTMSNALKFDLRDGSKRPRTYLIPNNGEIYFPTESIADMHFWRLKRDTVLSVRINAERVSTDPISPANPPSTIPRLAWYCLLQYALPHLQLKVIATIEDGSGAKNLTELVRQLAANGLKPADVEIEIVRAARS